MAATALDRLISTRNLLDVWKAYWPRVRNSTAGVDGITPIQFNEQINKYIRGIRSEFREDYGYTFSTLRGVRAPKKDPTKFRIICVPTVQDRLLQRALLDVIENNSKRLGISNDVSFGFVKDSGDVKRGTFGARSAAIRHRTNKPWAFKADITAFFDRIPRDTLIKSFGKAFSLSSLMPLIEGAIRCEVNDNNPVIRRVLQDNGIKKGRGLRQGMPLSPILSNFLLRDFDKSFIDGKFDLVRYADDLIVLADSEQECKRIEQFTNQELEKLGLEISSTKTEICPPDKAVEFLGMELSPKGNDGEYTLRVSDIQILKIRESFTDLYDVDFAVKEKLNLPKLLQRLENMQSSYKAAYNVADNFDVLSQQVEQWSATCIEKIYRSIFGKAIDRLTSNQRQFLLLPISTDQSSKATSHCK